MYVTLTMFSLKKIDSVQFHGADNVIQGKRPAINLH